jgi:hypothetical protein
LKQLKFSVTGTGDLYPLPTVSLAFPYGDAKSALITDTLRFSREAIAILAKTAPKIDGKLDDKCWTNPITKFFNPDPATPNVESTWFYFAHDKENLYIAAKCRDTKMDSIQAKLKTRDDFINQEDCIGFFIQPYRNDFKAYQIYFSPLGTVFDQLIYFGSLGYYTGKKSWNGNYIVKTSRDKDNWYVEAKIPLKQLNATGKSGQTWGINFLRKQKRLDAVADWQMPIDYNPKTYGVLKLK